jgi:pimeloyl-ACP methyl ester carboxylesterase
VAAVVELNGVRTWYAEYGGGDPLVYLHGGFSEASELDLVVDEYAARFRVFTPERRGHGHTPDAPGPFDFETNTTDTVAFLETVVGGPANLVGFSDGATTALHVALRRPDLVRRMVLISGQFHQSGLLPGLFSDDLTTAVAQMVASPLAQRYGEVSPDGLAHFPVVAEKVMQMTMTEPRLSVDALAGVYARTLVVSGDDDAVALEHTLALYRGLPDSELAVVPGTSHVLIAEKPHLVAQLVLDFLSTDAVPTIAPIRRRAE